MTPGLKTTIIASIALAGFLNLVQFATSYSRHAKDAFAPNLADAASSQPAATPKMVAKTTMLVSDAPTSTPVVTAPTPAAIPALPPAGRPATDPILGAQTKLTAAGLNPVFAANYLSVQAQTGTPWQILAAVHFTETGQSGDTARSSSAGAVGPMQFMPGTFAAYAQDGDGNGTKQITDFDDALLTAGNYLRAGGAAKGQYTTALYNYNHSNAYVSKVATIAKRLGL